LNWPCAHGANCEWGTPRRRINAVAAGDGLKPWAITEPDSAAGRGKSPPGDLIGSVGPRTPVSGHQIVLVEAEPPPTGGSSNGSLLAAGVAQPELDLHLPVVEVGEFDQLVA